MAVKFKKVMAAVTAASLCVGLASCSNSASTGGSDSAASASQAASTDTIDDNHGKVDVAVPVQKVVSTDNRTFQVLDQWGG